MPGGRPKGSRNKTSAFQRKIGEGGTLPVEYLLEIMRDDKQPQAERLKAAQAAAPYIHPKLSQVESTVTHKQSARELTDAELAEYLQSGSGEGTADTPEGEGKPTSVH